MTTNKPWWQKTTIYQIYPRSFKDSNGDGIGDIRGIISKLDYIQDLGVETIWFSPFFDSPQGDWGYDVRDYFHIAPEYGTLEDVEVLIDQIHQRGMRVLFDLVMNHTSNEHPWFTESRGSRDNPKRDWYIWRDGRGNSPPNNWKAIPGGSGWHYDDETQQWYYASFLPFQPDLNYRNPEVKAAMFEVARYWLAKGVDGFRLDIFHTIFKDEKFQDNPLCWRYVPYNDQEGFFQKWRYNLNLPETQDLAKEFRRFVETHGDDPLLLGELFGDDNTIKAFLGDNQEGLNLAFLWELLNIKPNANYFRQVIRHYEGQYPEPYIPVYVFGNHDRRRLLSNIGADECLGRLLALFQLTVRGVPVIYYGEEIGMLDGEFPAKESLDPIGQRYSWAPKFLFDLLGLYVNRDGCRTPMQWDANASAGFSDGVDVDPWLPVHHNYETANVSGQESDETSLLSTYRALLKLRRELPALHSGKLELIDDRGIDNNLLVFKRQYADNEISVIINFTKQPIEYINLTACSQPLYAVNMTDPKDTSSFRMPPYAGLILSN